MNNSINELKLALDGLIVVTGEMGVGKTSFALGYPASPDKIAFLNFDEKPLGGIESSLYCYHSYFHMLADIDTAKAKSSKAETLMLEQVFDDIKHIVDSDDKPELIIIDSAERFLGAFLPYVKKNAKKMKEFAGAGKWKARSEIGYAKVFATAFLSKLRYDTGAPVILVTHLGDKYVNNIAVGKAPLVNEILTQKAIFSLWLMHSEDSPVPNALVLKRIDKKAVTDRGIRQVAVLPPKLHSGVIESGDYVSLWDVLVYYWENPIGLRDPYDYETLNEDEFALITNTLTETQKNTLKIVAASMDEDETDSEIIRDMVEENIDKPLPMIAKIIKKEFPNVALDTIKSIKEELK